jgi:hypothetical protein
VEDGVYWGGYVLFGVHVISPLLRHRAFPAFGITFMGSSLTSEGSDVYNKGSLFPQLLFAKICGFVPEGEAASLAFHCRG